MIANVPDCSQNSHEFHFFHKPVCIRDVMRPFYLREICRGPGYGRRYSVNRSVCVNVCLIFGLVVDESANVLLSGRSMASPNWSAARYADRRSLPWRNGRREVRLAKLTFELIPFSEHSSLGRIVQVMLESQLGFLYKGIKGRKGDHLMQNINSREVREPTNRTEKMAIQLVKGINMGRA